MSDKIRKIVEDIEAMKLELVNEIAKQESHISYEIQNGYVKFEEEVIIKQKENMKNLLTWFKEIPFIHFLVAPIIYGMVIPAIIFDILLFVYQQVIFRVFKFKFIKRSDYILFDHHYLGYLNPIEKLNCLYCSYFNGLMLYASAIAGRTELYFCPIKHAKKVTSKHKFYDNFLAYGDETEYQKKLKGVRKNFKKNL
ncbi:MAG: hypothetical protein U9N49_10865 [Campylobacterota bacterium]|nr:hypothetical protein [Campylobacterota bacterium]